MLQRFEILAAGLGLTRFGHQMTILYRPKPLSYVLSLDVPGRRPELLRRGVALALAQQLLAAYEMLLILGLLHAPLQTRPLLRRHPFELHRLLVEHHRFVESAFAEGLVRAFLDGLELLHVLLRATRLVERLPHALVVDAHAECVGVHQYGRAVVASAGEQTAQPHAGLVLGASGRGEVAPVRQRPVEFALSRVYPQNPVPFLAFLYQFHPLLDHATSLFHRLARARAYLLHRTSRLQLSAETLRLPLQFIRLHVMHVLPQYVTYVLVGGPQKFLHAVEVLLPEQNRRLFHGLRRRFQRLPDQLLFARPLLQTQTDEVGDYRHHRYHSGGRRSGDVPVLAELLPRSVSYRRRPRENGLAPHVTLNVVGQFLGGLVAALLLLLQRLHHNRVDVLRHGRIPAPRLRYVFLNHPQQVREPHLPEKLVDRTSGEHLVQHRTYRVDVAGAVHFVSFAARLLRRHVRRRAHHHARASQIRIDLHVLRQTEVGYHRLAGLVYQYVLRLYVAVNDALLVRVVDGLGHLPGHLQRERHRQSSLLIQQRPETLAVYEVHREVVLAFELADVVDGHDVRVSQSGDGLGLEIEPAYHLLGGGVAAEQHFQRHDAVESLLSRFVNDAHSALRHFLDDLVVAELLFVGHTTFGQALFVYRRDHSRAGVAVGGGVAEHSARGRFRLRRGAGHLQHRAADLAAPALAHRKAFYAVRRAAARTDQNAALLLLQNLVHLLNRQVTLLHADLAESDVLARAHPPPLLLHALADLLLREVAQFLGYHAENFLAFGLQGRILPLSPAAFVGGANSPAQLL